MDAKDEFSIRNPTIKSKKSSMNIIKLDAQDNIVEK